MHWVHSTEVQIVEAAPGIENQLLIDGRSGVTSKHLALVKARYGPGITFMAHKHEVEEALYVVSGQALSVIKGESCLLKAGDAALVPAGAPHTLGNASQTEDLVVIGVFAANKIVRRPAED